MEHLKALVDGLCEAFLLNADNLCDELALFVKLGIRFEVFVDYGIANLVEERLMIAEKSAVTRRASEKSAQNVALALV